MCTVTLIPTNIEKKGFVLTSNRDEAANRLAIPPEIYTENGIKLLYPKDKESGGSWIGLSQNSRLICLLNGGFENHVRKAFYRKSRGVILKDLLIAENTDEDIKAYDFEGVEPFTIILVEWKNNLKFVELVWDGEQKHIEDLELTDHLWSSSPLYTSEMKQLRENWFSELKQNTKISAESIWDFHHTGGSGDKTTDVIMDRGLVKTHSITQVAKNEAEVKMVYEDLLSGKITERLF